jgi:hypothetical protein
MVTAIGRAFVASLSLGPVLLLSPDIAETRSPVVGPLATTDIASHQHVRGRFQFVPPGWTLYAPASLDDLFMRPDQGNGLIEVTCRPTRAGLDPRHRRTTETLCR